MTFHGVDGLLWPYVFVLLAAALPTMMWRWIGAYAAGRMKDDSEWLILARCISTALVAAVVAQFVFAPTGALATIPLALRLGAALAGFGAFLASGQRVIVGILVGEGCLIGGHLLLSEFG